MANISPTLYTNGFFGLVFKSPTQMGSLSVHNSVTNISRLGTFNLTNELNRLLHAIQSPFSWRIKENHGLTNIPPKSTKQEKIDSCQEQHFVERKKRKSDKNSSLRRPKFMHRNLDLKVTFKNSISGSPQNLIPLSQSRDILRSMQDC